MNKEKYIYRCKDAINRVSTMTIIILFLTIPIFSDEVVKKNGTVISNVKATVKRQTIRVEYENGRIEESSKKEFKTVRVRPIVWTSLLAALTIEQKKLEEEKEKERVAEASAEGSEWEFRPEEDQISPWGNAALSIIPGYSGLYRTKNYWGGGTFTLLETVAFVNFLDVRTAKEKHKIGIAEAYTVNVTLPYCSGQYASNGNTQCLFFSYTISDIRKGYSLEGGVTGRTIMQQGNASADTKRNRETLESTANGFLVALLLADAFTSYFAAREWNEGTFKGEKSQRPSTPAQRAIRSLFLPGYGQIYGGDKLKGSLFLSVGLLLAGKTYADDQAVEIAQKGYENNPNGFIINMPFAPTPVKLYAINSYIEDRKLIQETSRKRDESLGVLLAFWAYNVLDAYFFSGKNKIIPSSSMRIYPNFNPYSYTYLGKFEQKYELNLEFQF